MSVNINFFHKVIIIVIITVIIINCSLIEMGVNFNLIPIILMMIS